MKKEESEDIKKTEAPTPGAPVKEKKEKKEKTEKKKKEKKPKQADGVQLPVLVEFTYTISVLLLIFVSLAVIVVSFFTGASLLNLVLRTSAALLAIGCLSMVIFYQVSSGVLQASLAEQEEAERAQAEKAQAENVEPAESPANLESHAPAEAL